MEKNFDEMDTWAKSVFGKDASVSMSMDEWVISTGVKESFSWEDCKGTPAYAANEEYEETYGSTFDRWCAKNSQWGSVRESVDAYNSYVEESNREYCKMLDVWAEEYGLFGKTHEELAEIFQALAEEGKL